MTTIVFSFSENKIIAENIINHFGYEDGDVVFRHFPDSESHIYLESDVAKKEIIFVGSLNQPDAKLFPLLSFMDTVKELGGKSVGLIIPYLPYMRQDKRFQPREAITSKTFAALISEKADWLLTLDPHLHRYNSLDEIYSIPSTVLHAASVISDWIKANIKHPLIVGPDIESKQWVSEVAEDAGVPFIVLQKNRKGDEEVEISVPEVEQYKDHTPVLLDDIISTANTMIQTVKHLNRTEMKPTICIGIHAIFAGNAYQNLLNSGVQRIVTCNTIKHPSNQIDVSPVIVDFLKRL